jgi:hypothetical protein
MIRQTKNNQENVMFKKPGFAAEYAYASFASYYWYGSRACLSFTAPGAECRS